METKTENVYVRGDSEMFYLFAFINVNCMGTVSVYARATVCSCLVSSFMRVAFHRGMTRMHSTFLEDLTLPRTDMHSTLGGMEIISNS